MPPPGGFEAIKYKRNLPLRGPSGLVILGGVMAVCAYGFYRVGKGNLEKRYVESLRSFGRSVGGQAVVKRGQLWARPTGNVAFSGSDRAMRLISDKSGLGTAPFSARTVLMRHYFTGSSRGRRSGRAFTWSLFSSQRVTVTHTDVSKRRLNARGRS